jgi:hypothetical protein
MWDIRRFLFSPFLCIISSSYSSSFQSQSGEFPSLFLVRNVCWSSSDPTVLTIHRGKQHQDEEMGTLPPHLIFTFLKVQQSSISWEEMSSEANIFIPKPVSFVFTYQCAFQHVTREILPHLSFLYKTRQNMNIQIDRVMTFQMHPSFRNPSWTKSFLSSITNDLPKAPYFSTLNSCPIFSKTFRSQSSCAPFPRYWRPQHRCRPQSNWSFCANMIAFSNHLWYFDLESSDYIRKAVLGEAIYHPSQFICLNQRVGTRSILNLEEVRQLIMSMFPDHIVKHFSYEGKTFLEQAHLINTCKLVLHPHGGGETNLMFLQPNSTVIEFFSKYFNPVSYFGDLVTSTGSTHIPMIVQNVELPAGCEQYSQGNRSDDAMSCGNYEVHMTPCTECYKDANFIVDLDALRTLFKKSELTTR